MPFREKKGRGGENRCTVGKGVGAQKSDGKKRIFMRSEGGALPGWRRKKKNDTLELPSYGKSLKNRKEKS